jgi:3-deoxy-D-manno-octulosonic-acid transferase
MSAAQIPLALVNARLSSTSVRRYSLIKGVIQKILSLINIIACGSSLSAERFATLGADAGSVVVTGNAKYDVPPKSIDIAKVKATYFTSDYPLITLGSLRPGEEAFWFEAILRCKEHNILWAVVPRHPEKFSFFAQELEKRGITYTRVTQLTSPASSNVLLVDTMGIIEDFYASSSLAFVGGTLCPKLGGHNLFEPARYGVPVIAGPEGETIKDIREELVREHGMVMVHSLDEIVTTVSKAIRGELVDIGKKGRQVYAQHTGATKRIIDELTRRNII